MTPSHAPPPELPATEADADVEALRRPRVATDDRAFDAAWAAVLDRMDQPLRRLMMSRYSRFESDHDDWLQDFYFSLPTIARKFRGLSQRAFAGFATKCFCNAVRSRLRATKHRHLVSLEDAPSGDFRMEVICDQEDESPEERQRVGAREALRTVLHDEFIPRLSSHQQSAILSLLAGEANPAFAAAQGMTTKDAAKVRENAVKRLLTMARRRDLSSSPTSPEAARPSSLAPAPMPARDHTTGSDL